MTSIQIPNIPNIIIPSTQPRISTPHIRYDKVRVIHTNNFELNISVIALVQKCAKFLCHSVRTGTTILFHVEEVNQGRLNHFIQRGYDGWSRHYVNDLDNFKADFDVSNFAYRLAYITASNGCRNPIELPFLESVHNIIESVADQLEEVYCFEKKQFDWPA
uniref:Uncharacterized protein n=1 Tax=viral metagenome TaxID=1070528 RepID=A0A6C0KDF3_9ZZZZ